MRKKIFHRSLILAILAMTTLAVSKPLELNRIRAVVNGKPITQLEVDAALQMQVRMYFMGNQGRVSKTKAKSDIRAMEDDALEEVINKKLIISEFERQGGTIKPQFVDEAVSRFVSTRFNGDKNKFAAELKKSGMTLAQFREVQKEQIAVQALTSQNIGNNNTPLTPWAKKAKYNEIKSEFATDGQVKLRMLSIDRITAEKSESQQTALIKSIRSQLTRGSSFSSLAKKYSVDSFQEKGGYVGVVGKNTLNPGLTQLAYSLADGQVTQPIPDGPYWRILKSDGRVGRTVPSYEKLEPEVERRLKSENFNERRGKWLERLRRDANVRINE